MQPELETGLLQIEKPQLHLRRNLAHSSKSDKHSLVSQKPQIFFFFFLQQESKFLNPKSQQRKPKKSVDASSPPPPRSSSNSSHWQNQNHLNFKYVFKGWFFKVETAFFQMSVSFTVEDQVISAGNGVSYLGQWFKFWTHLLFFLYLIFHFYFLKIFYFKIFFWGGVIVQKKLINLCKKNKQNSTRESFPFVFSQTSSPASKQGLLKRFVYAYREKGRSSWLLL